MSVLKRIDKNGNYMHHCYYRLPTSMNNIICRIEVANNRQHYAQDIPVIKNAFAKKWKILLYSTI